MKKTGSYRDTADVFLHRRAVPDSSGAISERAAGFGYIASSQSVVNAGSSIKVRHCTTARWDNSFLPPA